MSEAFSVPAALIAGMVIREMMNGLSRLLDIYQKNQEAKRAAKARENEAKRAAESTEAQQLLDRYEQQNTIKDAQLARKDAQIEALQNVNDHQMKAHSNCREEVAELRMCLQMWRGEIIKLGGQPCELPPPRKHDDMEFENKTAQQTTKNLAAIDVRMHQKTGDGHENPST